MTVFGVDLLQHVRVDAIDRDLKHAIEVDLGEVKIAGKVM